MAIYFEAVITVDFNTNAHSTKLEEYRAAKLLSPEEVISCRGEIAPPTRRIQLVGNNSLRSNESAVEVVSSLLVLTFGVFFTCREKLSKVHDLAGCVTPGRLSRPVPRRQRH